MIKRCTVFFEGKYSPDYVSKFYDSLKRNTTVPFEFVCLSDTDVKADLVLPYNKHSNIKLHWHKLKFFSPQFAYQKPGDERLGTTLWYVRLYRSHGGIDEGQRVRCPA